MPVEFIFMILLVFALIGWCAFVKLHFDIKSVKNEITRLEEFHLKYIKDDIKRLEKSKEK